MKRISETRRLQCNKRNLEKIQLSKISFNRNKKNRFRTQSKTNRLIWRRMEEQNRESPEERNRREELYRVIEKIRETLRYKLTKNNKWPADKKQRLNPKHKAKKRC